MWNRRFPVVNLGQTSSVVVDRFAHDLIGKYGIIGVGLTEKNGRVVLDVMTQEDAEVVARILPREFMGLPISVTHTGEIIAF